MYDRYGKKIEDGLSQRVGAAPIAPATPLTSTPSLYALTYLIGDNILIDRVVRRYHSWETLADASVPDLAFAVGTWAAQLRIPKTCPVLPDLGSGISLWSRYEDGYPTRLGDLLDAPVLLYSMGDMPSEPLLGIGGTHFPSGNGLSVTKDAVKTAVSQNVPIIAALDTGCGHAAIEEVVARHGRVVAVASGDLSNPGSNSVLIRRVLDNGGAVISEWGPGEIWTESRTFESSRLVAALAAGVVIPELGTHPGGGARFAQEAIKAERYVIVPTPPPDAELPVGADALTNLVHHRNFSEALFGSNSRMNARVRAGYSPVDAVVSTPSEMSEAIVSACDPEKF